MRTHLLSLLLATSATTALAVSQEAPAQADPQGAVPSDFARFVKVGDGGHFDTAITTYAKDGVEVVFYAAVHIADRACYQKLNERFRGCDVLLYELVGEEDARPSKEQRRQGFNPIGMLQQALKNGLQLSFQLDEIDYQAKNFVHADMTPQEFESSMAERGESLLSIMSNMMTQSADKLREGGGAGLAQPDIDFAKAFRKGEGRHMMRMSFAQQLESMEMMAAGGEGSTLLEGRNEKCLRVLRRELANGHDRIGIYYGAAHMLHMERRLVEDMGFRKVKHEWIESWDCTRRADGDVELGEIERRRACKLQLLRIAKVGKVWRGARGADAAPPTDARVIAALEVGGKRAYEGALEDPWGTLVRVENRRGKQLWQAVSAGPDKEFGTKDDLTMRERAW
jgi:hypothetical protein